MSIISNNKKNQKEIRHAYEKKVIEMRVAEHNVMNNMLDILRNADRLMTAAEIEAACDNNISKHEIAGNLLAMRTGHSRYEYVNFHFGSRVPRVRIPRMDFRGNGEQIVTASGKREATVVEIDENGCIIPGTKREILLNEGKRYGIEKIK